MIFAVSDRKTELNEMSSRSKVDEQPIRISQEKSFMHEYQFLLNCRRDGEGEFVDT